MRSTIHPLIRILIGSPLAAKGMAIAPSISTDVRPEEVMISNQTLLMAHRIGHIIFHECSQFNPLNLLNHAIYLRTVMLQSMRFDNLKSPEHLWIGGQGGAYSLGAPGMVQRGMAMRRFSSIPRWLQLDLFKKNGYQTLPIYQNVQSFISL